ncbi:MAG TPA: tRNA (adenosine(37)-N6)-threonylcarbamoyltransferase complex transferase subunit TsaD [Anaerolineae bacterium]|nr:tRNA (adenosine(37)-N6)-threonylcarbamoyltransferase complex transferase subunit TsaD [Anaerolineae bacterium]
MRILGIETSCDETAAAVVQNGNKVLSNVIASQVELHAQYGGVFPEVASRQHVKVIYAVVEQALKEAHLDLKELDAIAVTRGPGLAGSLVVGMNIAKALSMSSGLSLIGINHLEGHIYSAWIHLDKKDKQKKPQFPLLALIVSGGHTTLIMMEEHLQYQQLGGTLDDAAGEAFDKVARLLGLSYPGGPAIQKAAETGNSLSFNFPRAWLDGSWNFSFSGLKTAVRRTLQELQAEGKAIKVNNLAASFQAAVVDVLATKTLLAARHFKARDILVAGGVSANRTLRKAFLKQKEFTVHFPPLSLCTDNAVMIAAAGYYHHLQGAHDELDMDVLPNWPLT